MAERDRKTGMTYYADTRINLGTTVRMSPRPLYQIKGGSEDQEPITTGQDSGESIGGHINSNPHKLKLLHQNHRCYTSPNPTSGKNFRYIKSGGWQGIRKEDQGKEFPW